MENFISMILDLTPTQLYFLTGILIFICLVVLIIFRYYSKKVEESSQMLRELYLLNNSYKFHKSIKKHERYTKPCNSKAQFDKVNLSMYFMSIIEGNIVYYDELIEKIDANKMLYKEYDYEYSKIKSTSTKELSRKYIMPLFLYKLIELGIYRRKKVQPSPETEFIIRATYVSKKGKNSYQKTFAYTMKESKKLIELVHLDIERKNSKKYQRALMSDALRWEIMHRDGFKCQLCGLSAKNGAILHVDHTIPIAKGGKTEKSNLRTLCDRCNLGKRDRIESL